MYEKQIKALAKEVATIKAKGGKSPRYPKEIWKNVIELRPHFTLAELAQHTGISASYIQKRLSRLPQESLPSKKAFSSTLIPIPSVSYPVTSDTRPPILEMELPSGVKIRIFS